jgi:tetratricopeptide (TPR) repeat protein
MRRAVEADPGYARAWAGLALGYVVAAHGPSPPAEPFARASAAAERALELDESIADAHAALAMIHQYQDWQWDAALREFERTLELDPSLAETRAHYSWNLQLRGRVEEALVEMERAERSDPLTPMWPAWRGWQLHVIDRHAEAADAARAALELVPEHPVALHVLGNALGGQGLWPEALAAQRRAAAASPIWRFAPALALAGMDREAEARALASEIAASAKPWDTLFLAEIHAVLGDRETALDWLERAFAAPHPYVGWIDREPAFESLRLEPRYRALLDRLELPAEALRRGG